MSTQMESWPRRHRITVHEYHRMAEVGLLAPDARVELIEGEIIDMAPIGNDHQSIVDQLTRMLVRGAGDDASRHPARRDQHLRPAGGLAGRDRRPLVRLPDDHAHRRGPGRVAPDHAARAAQHVHGLGPR